MLAEKARAGFVDGPAGEFACEEAVERFKAKGVAGPPPVVLAAIGAEPDFQGCDPAEVMAWL